MKNSKLFYIILAYMLLGGTSFGQEQIPSPRDINIRKEEIDLAKSPSIDRSRDAVIFSAGRKQFLKLSDNTIDKEKLKVKTVFKPEVGLIEVAMPPKKDGSYKLSLRECIDIAIRNNLQLQISQKNIALARMRLFEARRNMLPSAAITFQQYEGEVNGRNYVGRKQFIEGQQPIIDGGELFFTMKQAQANLEIVKNEYEKVKNELVLQVKKAYYTYAKAQENLKMQQDLSQEAERIHEMISKQFESGVAAKLEFLNVSSQASQVRYQLSSAEGDYSIAGLMLCHAMNLETSDKIDIAPNLEFNKVSVEFKKVLEYAFSHRPDVKINSLMVDYYKYGRNVAKAKGWPKITLMGNWGLAKEEYIGKDNGPKTDGTTDPDRKLEQQWYVGVKGSMPFWGSKGEYSWTKEAWVPVVSAYQGTEATTNTVKLGILDSLNVYSEKQSAVIDFDRARQELNKMKQDITLEVREGCFNYEKAVLQLETASNKVKYQEGDLELMKLRRSMDEAQDSNVVESMIKLAQEKFGYVQALTDCHISKAAIAKAVGSEDYFGDELVKINKK